MSDPFSDESVKRAIAAADAMIPASHTKALIAYGDTTGEWYLAYAQRVKNDWTVITKLGKSTEKGVEGSFLVHWSG